jgi:DNA-directed RNA polymerase specialized sigma24 family protein
MKKLSDARFAFLHDPDLYDLVGRLIFKWVRGDEAFAEDVRHGAYVVAMQLVLGERRPKPGTERGWMCRVARNHTHEAFRRRKEEEPPLETDEAPDLPVEDHQSLYEEQLRVEKQFDAVEQVASDHPEQVAQLVVADGRTKEGEGAAPKDAAARKRKERARTALASAITAAMTATIFLLWLRSLPPPAPRLPSGAYATLAEASHELAHQSCAAQKWVACVEGLDQTRALDATSFGPAEKAARDTAVAGIRKQALDDCGKQDFMRCLEGLDTARAYDPDGDNDPTVTLARSEAQQKLQGSVQAPFPYPDAKPGMPRHR